MEIQYLVKNIITEINRRWVKRWKFIISIKSKRQAKEIQRERGRRLNYRR